jgi:tryptophan halogenase
VEIAVDQLAQTLDGGEYDDGLRDAFNDGFSQLYDNIRDFLVLHFRTAARRDTEYWRACTGDPLMVPPRVADFIERWQHGEVPWTAPWPFAVGSWMYILDGNGVRPGTPARAGRVPTALDGRAARRRNERVQLGATLPSMRDFLADLRARYEAGDRASSVLPTTDDVWRANYERSFWGPEHEAFVHGAR